MARSSLVFFWNDETAGTSDTIMATRNDEIVLTHGDEPIMARYRAAGFQGRSGAYVDGPVKVGNTNGSWGFGGITDASGQARQNSTWWLKDSQGRNVNFDANAPNTFQVWCDPGSPGWRSFCKQQIKLFFTDTRFFANGRPAWDCFYLDEVWSLTDARNKNGGITPYNYLGQLYTDSLWQTAMNGYLDDLRAYIGTLGNYFLGGNIGNYVGVRWAVPHLDSALIENFATGWPSSTDANAATRWYAATDMINAWTDMTPGTGANWLADADRHIHLVGQSQVLSTQTTMPQTAIEQQRLKFSHGCYLMVAHPRIMYRYGNVYGANAYRAFWWQDDIYGSVDVGAPSGPRYQPNAGTQPNVWARDFANGRRITVDLAGHIGTISTTSIVITPPANTALPVVTGSAKEGQTLTTSNGTWANNPNSFSYQWQKLNALGNWVNISGANSATYIPITSDIGLQLRSQVTASNVGGSTSANSAATATITPKDTTPGTGDPSVIQEFSFANPTPATTFTGQAPNPFATGNTIMVSIGIASESASVTSVTDDVGNTYTQFTGAYHETTGGGAGGLRAVDLWVCNNAVASLVAPTLTVTLTLARNSTAQVLEVSSLEGSPADGSANGSSGIAASTWNSGTFSPTQMDFLFAGLFGSRQATTLAGGFTALTDISWSSTGEYGKAAYKKTDQPTQQAVWTPAAAGNYASFIAGFKVAPPPAPDQPFNMLQEETADNAGAGTSFVLTTPLAVTAGSLLLLAVALTSETTTVTISSSPSYTWQIFPSMSTAGTGSATSRSIFLFGIRNATAGIHTITVTLSAGRTGWAHFSEWDGVATTGIWFDQDNQRSQNLSDAIYTGGVNVGSQELAVAWAIADFGSAQGVQNLDPIVGFTPLTDTSYSPTGARGRQAYKIINPGQQHECVWLPDDVVSFAATIQTFRGPSTAPAYTPPVGRRKKVLAG